MSDGVQDMSSMGEYLGEEGDDLYIVISGRIRVAKAISLDVDRTLATLGPGAVFGELAMVGEGTRSASAICAPTSAARAHARRVRAARQAVRAAQGESGAPREGCQPHRAPLLRPVFYIRLSVILRTPAKLHISGSPFFTSGGALLHDLRTWRRRCPMRCSPPS